ncbi:hypothetical protein HLB44_31845 [Aquincola sp. S2]|uniref:Cellulose biosynthesis protein BcsF n=1 Tax=Pseudaquabacterium terrae TaxID=2732868 RepID=A0ABX2ESW3_9BURK|nr:hypothetical protein [Aquabacterium terrae]NRF71590.1 hypothetical protein [Aquabacterium terrae]
MELHEFAFLALLVLMGLALLAWISRQLQRPLEWMTDSRLDPASGYDDLQADEPAADWPLPTVDLPAREAKLQRG